ncbi:MAG: lipopolysaccharide assembly protein LapB [Cardiobacteriaceae bacterium]|nr:lipopolysaccharide assembly protein LapB [Cardiobacteriaceae bacterium]
MLSLLIILIPLAAWSGFWLALRHESRQARQHALRNTYLEGLNALLHDQTDVALESFIHLSSLDQQTLDTQLTLAALFRKRGELDRALHLHQQLLEYPLSTEQRHAIEMELALDYTQAGMYREALSLYEAHWQTQTNPTQKRKLAHALLKLYERLGYFQAAITLLQSLPSPALSEDNEHLAHYHSELAQLALKSQDIPLARAHLQSALNADPQHIRAHWLRAELALQTQQPINAIHDLHHIADNAPSFLPELLPLLERAYHDLGQRVAYETWLLEQEARYPNPRLTLATVASLKPTQPQLAKALLEKRLSEQKSPLLLSTYWQETTTDELSQSLIKPLQPRTVYQCQHCGFRQQALRWFCPSCHCWHGYQPLLILHQESKHPRS